MLPKQHRLTKMRDVERVSRRGRPVFGERCVVRFLPHAETPARIAVVASLKVSKRAVVRNRVKRLIREALRQHLDAIHPGFDIVVSAKPTMVGASYTEVAHELLHVFTRARLLRKGFLVSRRVE